MSYRLITIRRRSSSFTYTEKVKKDIVFITTIFLIPYENVEILNDK